MWTGCTAVEWHKDLKDPAEFLETVKIDLFAGDVFVFTPKGEVKELSHGTTPLDFAYAVHTDVGNKCVGAKVNGKIVPLRYRLKSGDTVEIVTSPSQTPSKDWLKIAKSSRAKAKIRAFIKQQERNSALEIGRELLEKALKPFDRSLSKLEKSGEILKAAQGQSLRTAEELYVGLGYGRFAEEHVLPMLVPKELLEKAQQLQQAQDLETEKKEQEESFMKRVFRSAKQKL